MSTSGPSPAAAAVNGVTTMLAEVQERDSNQVALDTARALAHEAQPQEGAASSLAVEGYVPGQLGRTAAPEKSGLKKGFFASSPAAQGRAPEQPGKAAAAQKGGLKKGFFSSSSKATEGRAPSQLDRPAAAENGAIKQQPNPAHSDIDSPLPGLSVAKGTAATASPASVDSDASVPAPLKPMIGSVIERDVSGPSTSKPMIGSVVERDMSVSAAASKPMIGSVVERDVSALSSASKPMIGSVVERDVSAPAPPNPRLAPKSILKKPAASERQAPAASRFRKGLRDKVVESSSPGIAETMQAPTQKSQPRPAVRFAASEGEPCPSQPKTQQPADLPQPVLCFTVDESKGEHRFLHR